MTNQCNPVLFSRLVDKRWIWKGLSYRLYDRVNGNLAALVEVLNLVFDDENPHAHCQLRCMNSLWSPLGKIS
jgi:hypothetical protein